MDQSPTSPSLAEWDRAFEEAAKGKYFRKLSTDQLATIAIQRKAAETRVGKRLARRHFIAKRGGLLTGLAITAVVIAAIAIFDRPPPGPDLSELGPEAVVQAYYEAIDGLDLATLEACLEGKAGKDDKSLVTNLTVVTKMRQAYTRDELFISAKEWVTAGSPELAEGTLMYGITDLEIRSLALESRLEARYTLWTTGSSEDSIRGINIRRVDRLVLAQGKKGWKIISIERESL